MIETAKVTNRRIKSLYFRRLGPSAPRLIDTLCVQ